MAELIPGLPDDLARECLMRILYDHFPTAASVCRNWEEELQSSLFHHLRKAADRTNYFIALVLSTEFFNYPNQINPYALSDYLVLFHPATTTWSKLVPFPDLHLCLPPSVTLAPVGRKLVAINSLDPQTWTISDMVHVYDFATGAWRQGTRMPGPRHSCFACAASEEDGLVFVASGYSSTNSSLCSALAYNVAANAWLPLPDMAVKRNCCTGIFNHGAFHVIDEHFLRSETFNVRSCRWEGIHREKLQEGDEELCIIRREWEVVAAPSSGDPRGEWRTIGVVPEEVRTELQVVVRGRSVLLLGAATCGGRRTGCVANVVARKGEMMTWREMKHPMDCYVLGSFCIEI